MTTHDRYQLLMIAVAAFIGISVAAAEPPEVIYDCHVHKSGYAATIALYARSETHAAYKAAEQTRPSTVVWCKERSKRA